MRRAGGAAAIALLSGCFADQRPAPTPSVTVLIQQDVLSLDPNAKVEMITDSVLFNVYEPLVGLDEHLAVRPMLAESWEHPNPEQWRFRLRRNVRFHDGTPLSAGLVRDALVALRDARNMEAAEFLSPVRQIVAVDAHTLDLFTQEPRALLANLPAIYITKKNAAAFPPLLGTGPYRVVRRVPGESVALERFAGYWGTAPGVERAQFVPLSDAAARAARLGEGRADIAYAVPPELSERSLPGVRFVHHEGVAVVYLAFNVRPSAKSPFADARVRRAVHLALDRRRLVDLVLRGQGSVATQPAPPQAFGFNPDLPEPHPDAERARRLLAEAGRAKGFKTRLDVFAERLPAAHLVQEDLGAVGIQVEINALAKEEVYRLARAGESEFFLAGWTFSSGEVSEFYEACLHTPSARWGYHNYGGYSNAEIDKIAETNAALLAPTERRDLLQRAAIVAMEELPVVPLYVSSDVYGVRDGVSFKARADGEIWLPDVRLTR
jgi:peptide/nickel transport system substrate-binding protein